MGLPRAVVPGRVYMVTRRCLERRFFLRPDREMTEAFVYCLAAAARRTGVKVIFSAVMANHHHTGLVDTDGRLPEFLEYLHEFVAKCGNALRGRWESFWAPEQASCVELVTPDAIFEKMVYALTDPVKDDLVERTVHWPGLDGLTAIAEGTPIVVARPKRFFRPDTALPDRRPARLPLTGLAGGAVGVDAGRGERCSEVPARRVRIPAFRAADSARRTCAVQGASPKGRAARGKPAPLRPPRPRHGACSVHRSRKETRR